MTASYFPSMPLLAPLRGAGLKMQVPGQYPGWKILAILCALGSAAMGDQFGNFTYTDNGPDITITGYPTSAVGVVDIPDTIVSKPVTSIGNSAFFNCTGLSTVTIASGVTSIGNSAFFNCLGLTSVTIPSSVTTIGNYAFVRCTALTSMTIPSSVTSIGIGAFANCSGLTSVVIPSSVTILQKSVFNTCSGLTSVTIPSSVTSIEAQVFQYCSALTSVTIPSGVTNLGDKAFGICRGLTSITIPAGVAFIGTEVFASCSALTAISVDDVNLNYSSRDGVLFDKLQTLLIAYPPGLGGGYAVPENVTNIGAKAFSTCDKLVGVTFPPGLTDIQSLAFSNCSALLYANFTGIAPTVAFNAFQLTSSGFTVYYLDAAAAGFNESPWSDYQNTPVNMGENTTPATAWLLSKGLPANSNIQSDSNGDGVSLLMACALNLDPYLNLTHSMPQPVCGANQMSLSFYAGSTGINYVVATSDDMMNWSTTGVTLSEADAHQVRTATVSGYGPRRFMRIEVSN